MGFITKYEGRFIFKCSYNERNIPKEAGFFWDDTSRVWYTTDKKKVLTLSSFHDEETKKFFASQSLEIPFDGIYHVPNGKELKYGQKEAIEFVLSRKHSYLALKPGMGKTICALVATFNYELPGTNLIICPPGLVYNWAHEIKQWTSVYDKIFIVESSKTPRPATFNNEFDDTYIICPDSLLINSTVQNWLCSFTYNYIVVDEAHRFKNDEAGRTKSLYGGVQKLKQTRIVFTPLIERATRSIHLSGSPELNRPMEIYPVLRSRAHHLIDYMSRFEFGMKYCGAKYNEDFKFWDFSGASNLHDLASRINGTFILRMEKQREGYTRQDNIIYLGDYRGKRDRAYEEKAIAGMGSHAIYQLEHDKNISKMRKEYGAAKAKLAAEYIKTKLDLGEKVVVFAHHRETAQTLATALKDYGASLMIGGTTKAEKYKLVRTFQTNFDNKVIVCNIIAAGIGHTLTAAKRVVFVEWDWSHEINKQASDRIDRHTQTQDINVDYLTVANSIDELILKTNFRKEKQLKPLQTNKEF
jgi:SWI/SNF-related matrix-associated actin-dependent regulator 1 of chromatin subfamily A